MIEKKHRALASIYFINDAVASNLAMITAWALRFYLEVIPVTKGAQDVWVYARLLPIVSMLTAATLPAGTPGAPAAIAVPPVGLTAPLPPASAPVKPVARPAPAPVKPPPR